MKLACQENLIPGTNLLEKWELVHEFGFAALELRGTEDFGLAARLPELREAQRNGVVFSSVCVSMGHFIGDADAALRKDAVANIKSQLSVIAELGGRGVITPASYGKFSRVLPGRQSPRSPAEDRKILLAAVGELGEHARSEGVELFLEPLNRYEDSIVNTLAEAAELCAASGLPSVTILADLFHMGIEEDDSARAIETYAPKIGHVHIADSNRREPGCGHTDFAAICNVLKAANYDGFLALECRFRAPAETALRNTAEIFRTILG